MKYLFLLITIFIAFTFAAQTPQGFNYSAVARDAAGRPLANKNMKVQISILKGNANGAVQYTETHLVNSDTYGLFNLVVGNGSVVTGTLSNLPWGADNYFLKTAIDANGGTNFLTLGTTQLLSVPYAMYAKNGIDRVSVNGDTLYLSNGQVFLSYKGNNNDTNVQPSSIGTKIFSIGNRVKDIEKNSYPTVILGTQEWMASNLKTTKFNNGDSIPLISAGNLWESITNNGNPIEQPAWCFYDNDTTNNTKFGKLYNWFAVSDGRNICPNGWHVPNDSDWTVLLNFIDPYTTNQYLSSPYAGGSLKSIGSLENREGLWRHPNLNATNSSGFNAIPSGYRDDTATGSNQGFAEKGYSAFFWSSSNSNMNSNSAYRIFLSNDNGIASGGAATKSSGFSVRCIKD